MDWCNEEPLPCRSIEVGGNSPILAVLGHAAHLKAVDQELLRKFRYGFNFSRFGVNIKDPRHDGRKPLRYQVKLNMPPLSKISLLGSEFFK
jgi:hypothetical protein